MSRLVHDNDNDVPEIPRKVEVFRLRKRRRKPLHPSTVHDLLREKAARRIVRYAGWHWPFGWQVTLQKTDGQRVRRNARTYDEAKEIRDMELESGMYWQAWIEMKTGEAAR